jgi:aryl-alcohol dehydrogenase-like predicted oxidoreductase
MRAAAIRSGALGACRAHRKSSRDAALPKYRGRTPHLAEAHVGVKQVVIARTALSVSRLSFGTASLHHLATRRARQRLLGHAGELGFSHFDTAPLYGSGLAEEELGRFFAARHGACTVATKVGLYPPAWSHPAVAWLWPERALGRIWPRLSRPIVSWSLARAEQSLHRSLRRLRRDHVDVLFLHEPDPGLLDADELRRWLERQRCAGKIRYHGLAGDAAAFGPWLATDHELCQILQLRDSLVRREADVAIAAGLPPQFAFGYLSARRASSAGNATPRDAHHRSRDLERLAELVRGALRRVAGGSVLVSSRRLDHVEQLCRAAREEA